MSIKASARWPRVPSRRAKLQVVGKEEASVAAAVGLPKKANKNPKVKENGKKGKELMANESVA